MASLLEPEEPLETECGEKKEATGLLSDLWTRALGWLHSFEDKYAELISDDLEWTSRMEGVVRAVSYLMTLGHSDIVSELVFSLSNMMVLFNDSILLSVLRRKSKQPILKRILFRALAIIETFQVTIEMVTRRYLGERWKWFVITLVSLFKSLSRGLLVFYLRAGLSHYQVSRPVDRQMITRRHQPEGETGQGQGQEANGTSVGKAWVGARTNKVVRSVQDDMSRPYEDLRESHIQHHNLMGPEEVPWSLLSQNQLVAEGISTARPIVHLLCMALFGECSFKSWLIPLGMDLTSLVLMGSGEGNLKMPEQQELTRKRFSLIYYIMRSPVYDDYFKARIMRILGFFADKIPLFGRLIEQFIIYLPTWQTTHFYVWAN